MTATIKPPRQGGPPRKRVPRFSSLESLGFSDSSHTWSDTPTQTDPYVSQRVTAPGTQAIADQQPTEMVDRLGGGNFRWSILMAILVVGSALGLFGWWLYQRPVAESQAATAAVTAQAKALEASLPALDTFNEGLLTADAATDTSDLDEVEASARDLFNGSGELDSSETDIRSASASAASSALDGVRLASAAYAYKVAVTPVLVVPELETDPQVIALDEAARSFGEWQLHFDEVRGALPDNVLPNVTVEIELLSADLSGLLTDYVDALREDSATAAASVLADLGSRLETVSQELEDSLRTVQGRVDTRIEEAYQALGSILDAPTP